MFFFSFLFSIFYHFLSGLMLLGLFLATAINLFLLMLSTSLCIDASTQSSTLANRLHSLFLDSDSLCHPSK